MKQKNADLLLLIQAGLLGFAPLFAMILLKTESYPLYIKLQEFLYISKISLTDKYWVIALLISILAGSGIAIYYQSNKTKRGALLCLSSFAFLKALVFLPLLVDTVIINPSPARPVNLTSLLIYYLLWFTVSLITLIYFARREKKLVQTVITPHEPLPAEPGEDVLEHIDLHAETLVIASREKRFVNYLVDSFIIVLAAAPVLGYLLNIGRGGIYADDEYSNTLLQTALGTFVYYTVFETCFRSTPGKYLSGTRVIHQAGKNANVLQTIGRSLCRLIPFDHFSFLGSRGWHDSIPRTEVIEAPQIKM